ncbi:SulP family inorganic anion transporter [Carnobacterium viridans]|uniref:Sulfate permease, SulP family n=1 Tax=Carnobacterium viridans TaxID=174587 RepID=A0A1H1A9B1_9LACT|nr:SulP family inorganic anion transporter [Carnobacterium viridans]UDE94245.1 SulP family inorganic anion transporter [Carnobacterium viridans]SDQ36253.1 sulfate permease, SulP family [Carnobacterium viridans]
MQKYKNEWFGNIKGDILAGIVVCLALFPEVIGFMLVAGVEPIVGIYATFFITATAAFFGGRTGLISAAAGSVALVLAHLVAEYGVEYLFAATILAGIIQVILSLFKVGKLMRYIPKPVMLGFLNGLGIMMFLSQLDHFKGNSVLIVLGIIGIAIILLAPKVTKKIPAPIISIVVITALVLGLELNVQLLGDLGTISNDLPKFGIPSVPMNIETLKIILPTALSVAIVGLVESLLTAQLVDELTNEPSDKNRESLSQGLGNVLSGFFGGIAGCGMIGQTIINLNYGGIGRLATFLSGFFMLMSVVLFNKIVVQIPIVALAAVMVVVAYETIDWRSVKRLNIMPKNESFVMLLTVGIVLVTHNLAYGVVAGTLVSAIFAAFSMTHFQVEKGTDNDEYHYKAHGHLYFASAEKFLDFFVHDFEHEGELIIDVSAMTLWDSTAVEAIDKLISKNKESGLTFIHANKQSKELFKKNTKHKIK